MRPGDAILDANGKTICPDPDCHGELTKPYEAGGYIVRRHKHRKSDGTLCDYGRGDGDPLPPRRPR